MSKVVSMRLSEQQVGRLNRYARTLGKTTGEASALIIEEKLREDEFASIEFRSSTVGRQAYMKGSRLTVWWVTYVAKQYELNPEKTAEYFDRPIGWVNSALNYYRAYPDEIDLAIEDHLSFTFEDVKRALPNVELIVVPGSVTD